MQSSTTGGKVITKVWTDGQQGEDNDYFADHCDGVTVTIGQSSLGAVGIYYYYLTGLTSTEKALLKKCLGPSDFDSSNNVEVYNWDYGSELYPHMIKLVRSVTVYTDGGYYAVIWYDTSLTSLDDAPTTNVGVVGTFRILNTFTTPDAFKTDNYDVYTTTGTLALTSNTSRAVFSFGSKTVYMTNSSYDSVNSPFDGDISCEVGNNNVGKFKYIHHCLNKTDLFTLLSWESPVYNPPNINLYTAARLFTKPFEHLHEDRFDTALTTNRARYEMHYGTHVINTDLSTNWGAYTIQSTAAGVLDAASLPNRGLNFRVYKFFPATASTYNYVNQCSNRGICDQSNGLCNCFPGYTNDDCSVQNSIAL